MKKNIKMRSVKSLSVLKTICTLVCVSSFVFMLFTAGASDLELITVPQTVLRSMIGMWMFGIGMVGHRLCYVQMIKQRRRIIGGIRSGKIESKNKIKSVA